MKDIWVIGVDLGKNSCSLVGLDAAGHAVLRAPDTVRCLVGLAQTAHLYRRAS